MRRVNQPKQKDKTMKKTPLETCRDAVKQAQKQIARAEAAAAKAEIPMAETLNQLNGQLYAMAALLTKANAPMLTPTVDAQPAVNFQPLPLRTAAEVEAEQRQKVAAMLGVPLEHVHAIKADMAGISADIKELVEKNQPNAEMGAMSTDGGQPNA
jgi:hypothetical protein